MADPTYKQFVKTHGGKSTSDLAAKWRKRFGPQDKYLGARDSRGVMEPRSGNPGLRAPEGTAPPIGNAGPTPPDRTGDIPDMQPPTNVEQPAPNTAPSTIADAVSGFVQGGGAPGEAPPAAPSQAQTPLGPNAEAAAQLGATEGNPEIAELLRKFQSAF